MKFNECLLLSKRINNINLKKRTKVLYKYMIKKYINPYYSNLEIEDIKENILQEYLLSLADKKFSTNTIKLIWRIIESTIKENKLDINLEEIVVPKTHEKQVEAFSSFEQKQIEDKLDISKSPKHIGILLALYLGLRLGEVLALKWGDIDFVNKTIQIKRTVYAYNNQLIYSTPKTKSSVRTIPLPIFLEAILKKIKAKTSCEFVVSQNNKQIVPRTYQHFFKSLQKKAKITNPKGFHSLRHSFATRAIECGMDIKCLADILGHKNPTVTLNRYAHSMMDYKKSMMNKIGKLYN
ncbi:MAG: tyrosine-type recombinase/integrase [Candidatus Onthoplasma sp.]